MREINFGAYDLDTPSGRQSVLKEMPPDREAVAKHHSELLDLFRREIKFRRELLERTDGGPACKDGEIDYSEHLYWCGLLLYLIGDPADVSLMWEAKSIDMDTGCSFDTQFMVGGGVDDTIKYLEDQGQTGPASLIKELKKFSELDDLQGWERFRIHYFYPQIVFRENGG
jgi:hypothetical protein